MELVSRGVLMVEVDTGRYDTQAVGGLYGMIAKE